MRSPLEDAGEPVSEGSATGSGARTARDVSRPGWAPEQRGCFSADACGVVARPPATAGALSPVAPLRPRVAQAPPGPPALLVDRRSGDPEQLLPELLLAECARPEAPPGRDLVPIVLRECARGAKPFPDLSPETQSWDCLSRPLASGPDLARPGPGRPLKSRRPGAPPEALHVRQLPGAAGRAGLAARDAGPSS